MRVADTAFNAFTRMGLHSVRRLIKSLQAYASTRESLGLAVTFIASKPDDGYRRETVTVDLCAINPIRSGV